MSSDWSFTFTLPEGKVSVTVRPSGIRLTRDNETAVHSFDELFGRHSHIGIGGWADQRLSEKVRSTKALYPLLDAAVWSGVLDGTFDEMARIASGREPLRGFGEKKRTLLAEVLSEYQKELLS